MILVDNRTGSIQLADHLHNCTLTTLESADVMFISKSNKLIGIERKTISEMVASAKGDKRFTGSQLPAMQKVYDVSWLLIDGYFKISGDRLIYYRRGAETIQYSHLMNHLLTLQLCSGLHVAPLTPRSIRESAMFVQTLYNWYKMEDSHHSHIAVYDGRQSMLWQASTKRKIAMQLSGVGHELSERVNQHFSSIKAMINANVDEWCKIDKIGKKKAKTIVNEIRKETT